MSYGYTEIVDSVDTPDGMTFRALIVQDDDPQEPYFDAGCPVLQIDTGRGYSFAVEATNYGAGQDDGLTVKGVRDYGTQGAAEILEYFHEHAAPCDRRTAIDTFERYLHIYHDGNLVSYGPNQGTDYTYVAYMTRTLWESWGNTGEVGRADLDEWRAYVEGDTYGIMVEYCPTVEIEDGSVRSSDYGDVDHDGWTETDGTCWGFYGQQYAEESAREELAAEVASHNDKDAKATLFQL